MGMVIHGWEWRWESFKAQMYLSWKGLRRQPVGLQPAVGACQADGVQEMIPVTHNLILCSVDTLHTLAPNSTLAMTI